MLHLACRGAVGFSKLLASSGLQVTASESCEVSLRDAGRRGIRTLELPEPSSNTSPVLPKGCLGAEGKYDVIVVFTGEESLPMRCNEDIDEIWRALPLGGTFAIECPAREGRSDRFTTGSPGCLEYSYARFEYRGLYRSRIGASNISWNSWLSCRIHGESRERSIYPAGSEEAGPALSRQRCISMTSVTKIAPQNPFLFLHSVCTY